VRQTLDDAGNPLVASDLAYSPFGLPQSGALPDPFGFTGELHHNDLVYLRARWYDPGEGTLLGRDPFAGFDTLPYSLHPYQYGYSDPVRYSDPTGHCVSGAIIDTVLCATAVIAVAGAIAVAAEATRSTQMANDAYGGNVSLPSFSFTGSQAENLARGWDYATSRGEGYVWTGGAVAAPDAQRRGDPPSPVTPPRLDDVDTDALSDAFESIGEGIEDLVCTDTSTQDDDDEPVSYVADSNIFMDRPGKDPTLRARIDTQYLSDPNVTLYVPAAAVAEVLASPSASQAQRLQGYTNGARVIQVPDPDMSSIPVQRLESRNFDETDMTVLELARQRQLSVLTANTAMINQVGSHVERRNIWGNVRINVP
jgi:RHS repeat-associated protein